MVILAFMQNMWVKDVDRVERLIAKHGERYRQRAIAMFLFAGCVSGRRLKQAFGDELCGQIKWDEVSRQISGHPAFVPTADEVHMQTVIAHYKPDVIICFGKIAANAIDAIWRGTTIKAPHPASRQPDVMQRLMDARDAIPITIPQ